MALFARRKADRPIWIQLPAPYRLKESRFTFAGDDGAEVEGIGYVLFRGDGEVFSRESSPKDEGIYMIRAAGFSHRDDGGAACFSPGRTLCLRPDPSNPFDPAAVKILDGTGTRQLGFVPKSDLASLPPHPERMPGIVMTEYRRGGRRVGVTAIFVGPPRR